MDCIPIQDLNTCSNYYGCVIFLFFNFYSCFWSSKKVFSPLYTVIEIFIVFLINFKKKSILISIFIFLIPYFFIFSFIFCTHFKFKNRPAKPYKILTYRNNVFVKNLQSLLVTGHTFFKLRVPWYFLTLFPLDLLPFLLSRLRFKSLLQWLYNCPRNIKLKMKNSPPENIRLNIGEQHIQISKPLS